MKNCIHYKIKIKGKVQGVWFRKYTEEKALELGLKGYVMNQSDGSVYTEIESLDEDKFNRFITWLHRGSPLSKVDKVEVLSKENCIGFQDFKIKK